MTTPEAFSNHSDSDETELRLTHVDHHGAARMVDVGAKTATKRIAVASSRITMNSLAANAIRNNDLKKGDCIQVARIAAIQAVKQTSSLIPLCHTILIDSVDVRHQWLTETELAWEVSVSSTGLTGVEMEALTAASIAALTVYDMCKALDRTMKVSDIVLISKTGGSRGDYYRKD